MDNQSIASRLREALDQSVAPYPMACVAVGGNGISYSGYNLEPASDEPVHAEDMALDQLPSGVRATAVHIMSSTDGFDGVIRAIRR